MNTDTYKTIKANSQGGSKDKGSKFLAFAYPISTLDEVKPLVDALRTQYYDARHVCYAYRIGQHGESWRAVDDGEPSGTAGRPILGQLMSAELTNILVVVVRYFGGTKLGVSGLIQAYKEATIDVLDESQIIERTIENSLRLSFGYFSMNDVMKLIKDNDINIVSQSFDNSCKVVLSIRRDASDIFIAKAAKIEGLTIEVI